MKDDLISRKAAIEEMLKCGEYYNGNDEAKRGVAQCIGVIHELPSAQPEKRTEERTETHARDPIDRAAAIEHLKKRLYETEFNSTAEYPYYQEIANNRVDVWMNEVPSAQPEIEERKEETAHFVPKEGLISRKAAIDALGEAPKFKIGLLKKYAEGRNDQWFDDVAALVKLPSAQPEIIRCSECRFWMQSEPNCWCCSVAGYPTYEDDFCSQAERRTDENNNE